MSFTHRGRRFAFDNIAVGSATGRERTISGGGKTDTSVWGMGERLKTSEGGQSTPTSTGNIIEHYIAGTTDQTNA